MKATSSFVPVRNFGQTEMREGASGEFGLWSLLREVRINFCNERTAKISPLSLENSPGGFLKKKFRKPPIILSIKFADAMRFVVFVVGTTKLTQIQFGAQSVSQSFISLLFLVVDI